MQLDEYHLTMEDVQREYWELVSKCRYGPAREYDDNLSRLRRLSAEFKGYFSMTIFETVEMDKELEMERV